MVAALTTSGRPLDVVIAPAGTGKTFSLDAARDAWQRSGHHVIGTALAARAAAELEATAGIPSHTIASLLADLDHPDHGRLRANTVLVVDEAGMVGTRLLARILDHATPRNAKVVLVGDPRQLPEIDAGGLLRGLGERLDSHPPHPEPPPTRSLGTRPPSPSSATDRIDDAVAALPTSTAASTPATPPSAARDAMVADWWAATLAGDRVLMLASRWSDVDDLNARARHHYQTAGRLTGPTLIVDERPYQAGDRIMTLRNNRRLGVRNGTCATIDHVDADAADDAGPHRRRDVTHAARRVPRRRPRPPRVRHHHPQSPRPNRRPRLRARLRPCSTKKPATSPSPAAAVENRIYLVDSEPRPEAHAPEVAPPDPLDTLTQALAVSHAQHLAIDAGIDRDADPQRPRQPRPRTRPPPRTPASLPAITRLRDHRAHQPTRQPRRTTRRRRAANSRRSTPNTAGATARTETLDRIVLTNQTSDLAARLTRFDDSPRHAPAKNTTTTRPSSTDHGDELDRLPRTERAIDARIEQLVDADTTDPPAYLHDLGAAPTEADALDRWRRAAALRRTPPRRPQHHRPRPAVRARTNRPKGNQLALPPPHPGPAHDLHPQQDTHHRRRRRTRIVLRRVGNELVCES